MLFQETVEAGTLDLIKTLMADSELEGFNLVGGTALSLQVGHRISIDIDLFTDRDFDSERLANYLEKLYKLSETKIIKNGIFGFINGVKLDLIAHKYPLIYPIQNLKGIRIASLPEIGAMKLNVIVENGSRYKDFVDMYFLLEHYPLKLFTDAYEKKYAPNASATIARTGLIYFADIDYNISIRLLRDQLSKEMIQARLKDALVNYSKVYTKNPKSEKKINAAKRRVRRHL